MDDNMYHNLQGRITILENNLEVAANLLAKDGKHLIHAMKFYRDATGASLKAAKHHVEFIREGEKEKDDRLQRDHDRTIRRDEQDYPDNSKMELVNFRLQALEDRVNKLESNIGE